MGEHWFWWMMTMACVAWYSAVTGYVAVRGAMDIKTMLKHLASLNVGQPVNLFMLPGGNSCAATDPRYW